MSNVSSKISEDETLAKSYDWRPRLRPKKGGESMFYQKTTKNQKLESGSRIIRCSKTMGSRITTFVVVGFASAKRQLPCTPGHSWALLGTPGRSWALLGTPGRSWPLLAAPGLSWPRRVAPRHFWSLLAAPGCSWPFLGSPGHASALVGTPGRALLSVLFFFCFRRSSELHVYVVSSRYRAG